MITANYSMSMAADAREKSSMRRRVYGPDYDVEMVLQSKTHKTGEKIL